MSSPFALEFYNDKHEKVGMSHGNHGWASPTNFRYAENIIRAVNEARFKENQQVEWSYFITYGRVYFKEDYDKMVEIVGLISSFDPYDFSMEIQ